MVQKLTKVKTYEEDEELIGFKNNNFVFYYICTYSHSYGETR